MKSTARKTLLLFTAAGVVACGGGGGGSGNGGGGAPPPAPVSNVSPGGIFLGEITGCTTVCPIDSIFLISEVGTWMGVDPAYGGGVNIGQITVSGAEFDSSRLFFTGTSTVNGFIPTSPARRDSPMDFRAFDGVITERSRIEGTYHHNSGSNVRVVADYVAEYDIDSSLQALAGTYSASDGAGFTLTYVIDTNGVITGSDSSGCTANGQAAANVTDFNLYNVTLDFSGCGAGGASGTFDGMASVLDMSGTESLLIYGLSTDEQLVVVMTLPTM